MCVIRPYFGWRLAASTCLPASQSCLCTFSLFFAVGYPDQLSADDTILPRNQGGGAHETSVGSVISSSSATALHFSLSALFILNSIPFLSIWFRENV